jgi:hypothetical protein
MDKQFDKEKIKLYGVVFLIVVFVLVSINSARTIAKKKQMMNVAAMLASKAKSVQSAQAPVVSDKAAISVGALLEQRLEGLSSRDPFKRQAVVVNNGPGNENKGSIGGVLLTGIVYDSQNPSESYCVINGQTVKVGEYAAGFIVKGVEENFVVLTSEKENKEYKVGLWGEIEQ